jgi:hypothetical protein
MSSPNLVLILLICYNTVSGTRLVIELKREETYSRIQFLEYVNISINLVVKSVT